jgi:hypothetical protein
VLVIATALVIAAVLTAVVIGSGRILLNVRNEAEQAVGKLTAVARKTMSFAYSVERVRSVVTISSLEGDANVLRELHEVRPTESMTMRSLHGKVSGSGEVTVPPALVSPIVGAPGDYVFSSALKAPGEASYEIEFKRPLSHNEAIDLAVQTGFRHLHRMTRAEIGEAYRGDDFRNEYTAMTIDVPVGVLELEVVFPAGFKADVYGVVFYGDSETVAEAESRAVRDAVTPLTDSSFRLTIANPQLRFQYGIYWIPAR